MSDYDEDSNGSGILTPNWLSMPSPKTLLDKTTKFVLNAAHGKSRSLIPTSEDPNRGAYFNETGVIDWGEDKLSNDEDDDDYDEEEDAEEGAKGARNRELGTNKYLQSDEDGTFLIPINEILKGRWNTCTIISTSSRRSSSSNNEDKMEILAKNGNDVDRPLTPLGMVRVLPNNNTHGGIPPRRRTAPSSLLLDNPGILQTSRSSVSLNRKRRGLGRRHTKHTFISLPPSVISRIFQFLPVPELLCISNSCRAVRRVVYKREPSSLSYALQMHNSTAAPMDGDGDNGELKHEDRHNNDRITGASGVIESRADDIGESAYTLFGLRIWRILIWRMGWRVWRERIRGRERRQRVSIPRSHGRLLREISGIETEDELLEVIANEPDLLFKAIYDNLRTDYMSFRNLDKGIERLAWSDVEISNTDSSSRDVAGGNGLRATFKARSPEKVAERLDQLLWFGRGRFTHDSEVINRRLFVEAERFESAYAQRFRVAFLQTDCEKMQEHARILENIREGRCCIRILVDSHPLFNGNELEDPTSSYSAILSSSDKVVDSQTFGDFLNALQTAIQIHSKVVSSALPPPNLPTSALHCFIQALFTENGIALFTLKKLYTYLKSIPIASQVLPGQSESTVALPPDEAAKDILYLTVIADVVSLLLVASRSWSTMQPVNIPTDLARRSVFAAFNDVIDDYVQLEKRIIERAYEEELGKWMSKTKSTASIGAVPGQATSGTAAPRSGDGDVELSGIPKRRGSASSVHIGGLSSFGPESIRLVNFRQRVQQMEDYKRRVLSVLESRLKIKLDQEAPLPSVSKDSTVADQELNPESTTVPESCSNESAVDIGSSREYSAPNTRQSIGGQSETTRRTIVGDMMWNSPISIDLCLNMVLANREAIDRLAVFTEAPPDMRLRRLAQDTIESVFCILLQSVGNHIRPAFKKIISDLRDLEHTTMIAIGFHKQSLHGRGAKVVNDSAPGSGSVYSTQQIHAEKEIREKFTVTELKFFELVHLCDLAVQMMEIYYKKDLCKFIIESDFLNICNQEKRALERAIDDNVAVGMDCVIEIIMRQTQNILDTEQRVQDYYPNSNVSLTLTPTLACTRAVQFLDESTEVLRSMTTQKQMREVFLGEIGIRLFNILFDHIKRFQITEPGGFQLIADLNLYYDWAGRNVDPETLRFFTALKDLANCFILAPKDLRGFLRDQYTRHTFDGVMRSEEVYDVVACRADYKQIRTQVEGHCDFM